MHLGFQRIGLYGSLTFVVAWIATSCTTAEAPLPVEEDHQGSGIVSLLGVPLPPVTLPEGFREEQLRLLAEAESDLGANADNPDALIWVGRRLGYLGRYEDAIAAFSRGVERHADDARFRRHRGHRLITVRRFDDAIADLERGTAMVAGRDDVIEPDGLPNAQGQPTSTLQTNLWYHLGLAHYLKGDFAYALPAFRTCHQLASNPDMRVAASYWWYLAARRLGRGDLADRVLAPISDKLVLIENHDYHRLLLAFRGGGDMASLLAAHPKGSLGYATTGYGVASWHWVNGRREQARALFEEVVAADGWSAFGSIAAEADLARWDTTADVHGG